MGIRFRCKNCRQKYELDNGFAGQDVECVRCQKQMTVPVETELPSKRTETSTDSAGKIKRAEAVADLMNMQKIKKVQSISQNSKSASEEDIVFRCKICNQKYRLPQEMAGQNAECAKCKRNIVVPEHSELKPAAMLKATVKSTAPEATSAKQDPQASITEQIAFRCKSCGQKYRLSKDLIGVQTECTRCKNTIEVPEKSDPELLAKSPAKPAPATKAAGSATATSTGFTEHEIYKTHTQIDLTKTLTSLVRYVIEIPEHNFIAGMFYFTIDWLLQYSIFKKSSRKFITFALCAVGLMLSLYVFNWLTIPKAKNAPLKCAINTMCPECQLHEIRNILAIDNETCRKCKKPLGYAWKCDDCGKYFPYIEPKVDPSMSRKQALQPKREKCPFCRSYNVHYASIAEEKSKK